MNIGPSLPNKAAIGGREGKKPPGRDFFQSIDEGGGARPRQNLNTTGDSLRNSSPFLTSKSWGGGGSLSWGGDMQGFGMKKEGRGKRIPGICFFLVEESRGLGLKNLLG